jgi:hypothetical protein
MLLLEKKEFKPMNFDLFTAFNSDDLWLEFTTEEQDNAWRIAEGCSPGSARYQAYLNALAGNCFLKWLKAVYPTAQNIRFDLSHDQLLTMWEFVNGTGININYIRLILIPQESEDLGELIIPQEWVDLPRFTGNYYLPVQVNIDDQWLRFWGFISYDELKENAIYDSILSEYSLEQEYLESDLNLLFLLEKYCQVNSALQHQNLVSLSSQDKQKLLEKIEQVDSYNTRLKLPFNEWGVLVSDDGCRGYLYQKNQPLNLSVWFLHNFQQAYQKGWQNLLNLSEHSQNILAEISFNNNGGLVMRSDGINLQHIYQIKNEQELKIAAQRLSKINIDSPYKNQALAALTYIMTQCKEDDTRWSAAESIWRLEPNHPHAGFWCGKRINLGIDLANFSLTLIIGLLPKSATESSIFLRLCSENIFHILPPNLTLEIIDNNSTVFKRLVSRQGDGLLQYQFWGKKGEYFEVKLTLGNSQLRESFII